MTTTQIPDTLTDLDADFDEALNLIRKHRARGKFAALSLLGAALLALLGATLAMYSRTPAAPEFRTGTSR